MSKWPRDNIKFDEIWSLINTSAKGLESGISSVETVENTMKITCNDGREITLQFNAPYDMNRVTDMYVANDCLTVVQWTQEGHRVKHKIKLDINPNIVDPIKATCSVGGVASGSRYQVGYPLESIVRQILSGESNKPKIEITTNDTRCYRGAIYLDRTEPAALNDINYNVFTSVSDAGKATNTQIIRVWEEAPNYSHDEVIGDPFGEKYNYTGRIEAPYEENKDGYFITARLEDNKGHTNFAVLPVIWSSPFIVGVYTGEHELDIIKKYLEIPVEEHDELTPEERQELFPKVPMDSSFVMNYLCYNSVTEETEAWTQREVIHSLNYEYELDSAKTGRLVIAYPSRLGKLLRVDLTSSDDIVDPHAKDLDGNTNFYCYYVYVPECKEEFRVYIQKDITEYNDAQLITIG